MIKVVGVRFKKAGKIYYFDPVDMDIQKDTYVVVETARGIEFGECVIGIKEISENDIVAPHDGAVIAISVDKGQNVKAQ